MGQASARRAKVRARRAGPGSWEGWGTACWPPRRARVACRAEVRSKAGVGGLRRYKAAGRGPLGAGPPWRHGCVGAWGQARRAEGAGIGCGARCSVEHGRRLGGSVQGHALYGSFGLGRRPAAQAAGRARPGAGGRRAGARGRARLGGGASSTDQRGRRQGAWGRVGQIGGGAGPARRARARGRRPAAEEEPRAAPRGGGAARGRVRRGARPGAAARGAGAAGGGAAGPSRRPAGPVQAGQPGGGTA
jgi:hypothetical protein